ncbi:ribosomal RNA-processing protein 8 [Vanessa cardui]|uniref:ribosomal RNA-processing protein 8 n=1 Tax=Vanessa cardui TaxID=171605 RepID=UPI001F142A13|nr:ribosomal RNA-processing protein 8 [Vanessa cardui]
MFKIPEWDEDIPKGQSKMIKPNPKEKNKLKKNKTPPSVKQNDIKKPNFKSKKKMQTNPRKIKVNNVKQLKIAAKNISKPKLIKNNTESKIATIPAEEVIEKIVNKKPKPKKTQIAAENEESSIKNNNYYDTDNLDELIIHEKKKKLNKINNDDVEKMIHEEYSEEKKKKTKNERKKELIKTVLQKEAHRSDINVSSNPLRERMLERLKAAKFRFLNEKLYTTTGSEAQKLFEEDPTAFQTYHEGYQQQMKKWPVKPLDVIIKRIQKMPKSYKIADMGCGEAELSRRVAQSVRSFDLVARAPGVEACDVTRTPLCAAQLDAAVYCLALMGTELTRYLLEANRVLRVGGHLLIAEVESRFDNVDDFVRDVQRLGFSLKKLDKTHKVFFFMEFTKIRDPPVKKSKLPILKLKPCIYKKR